MLPVELLNKILADLSTSDLLCNVARLNKKFHEIAHSPHVHLVVTLKAGADEEQGSKFLETATQMREVNITHDQTSGGNCDKKILALANHYRLRFVKISTSAKITAVTFIKTWKSSSSISGMEQSPNCTRINSLQLPSRVLDPGAT